MFVVKVTASGVDTLKSGNGFAESACAAESVACTCASVGPGSATIATAPITANARRAAVAFDIGVAAMIR